MNLFTGSVSGEFVQSANKYGTKGSDSVTNVTNDASTDSLRDSSFPGFPGTVTSSKCNKSKTHGTPPPAKYCVSIRINK